MVCEVGGLHAMTGAGNSLVSTSAVNSATTVKRTELFRAAGGRKRLEQDDLSPNGIKSSLLFSLHSALPPQMPTTTAPLYTQQADYKRAKRCRTRPPHHQCAGGGRPYPPLPGPPGQRGLRGKQSAAHHARVGEARSLPQPRVNKKNVRRLTFTISILITHGWGHTGNCCTRHYFS